MNVRTNLVFRSRLDNILKGILCDLHNAVPSSVQFRKYHLKHHTFQGHYNIDADISSVWEAKLKGNSFFGKAIWLLLYTIFQVTRPPRLREVHFSSIWMWIDLVLVLGFDLVLIYFFGLTPILYLLASFFFSVGLHPLGGRWIQEHYLTEEPQETYSYYEALNSLAFNVGYFKEHHDFSYISWNKLPEIKRIEPDQYETLTYHTYRSSLVWKFIDRTKRFAFFKSNQRK